MYSPKLYAASADKPTKASRPEAEGMSVDIRAPRSVATETSLQLESLVFNVFSVCIQRLAHVVAVEPWQKDKMTTSKAVGHNPEVVIHITIRDTPRSLEPG